MKLISRMKPHNAAILISRLFQGASCQGFSTVGSKNRKDPRNSLFYEYLRAVAELNPSYVIFENVLGFKKMYDGEAFNILTRELKDLGYDFVSSILEASDYGLPQKGSGQSLLVGRLT